jgi:hypothetical protein
MNEIKVTVNYIRPTTNKFDALLEQYNEVKQLSEDTVSYYQPLAEMAEEAKLNAILAQLETIKTYLKKLHSINGVKHRIRLFDTSNPDHCYFDIEVSRSGEIEIFWNKYPLTINQYLANPHFFNGQWYGYYNILGNWDKWNFYERLEKECIDELTYEIEKQKNRAIEQVERLKNITGEQ